MRATPSPTVIKSNLFDMSKLCITLATDYTMAYESGYLAVRKPNSDGTPKGKGSHSDPTADIAISSYHDSIRGDTAQAALEIDKAHRSLIAALKLLNGWAGYGEDLAL